MKTIIGCCLLATLTLSSTAQVKVKLTPTKLFGEWCQTKHVDPDTNRTISWSSTLEDCSYRLFFMDKGILKEETVFESGPTPNGTYQIVDNTIYTEQSSPYGGSIFYTYKVIYFDGKKITWTDVKRHDTNTFTKVE